MLRTTLSILLSVLLGGSLQAESPRQASSIEEQVLKIPTNGFVDVRLKTKERIRGRLGEIAAGGFSVQFCRPGRWEEVRMSFADVKSVREIKYDPRKANRIRGIYTILSMVGLALLAARRAG